MLGARLADGRRVVVKVHGPRTSARYLAAMQTVQHALAGAGFPAPAPLAPPQPLDAGIAVAETLLDAGERADGHDPAVRRTMARELARLVALCRELRDVDGLRENTMATGPADLWPQPHDGRFDFAATTPGAEWLDAVARRARAARDRDAGDVVVGHTDWRVQHLRFAGGELTAVYDWDSLAIQREPVLAGGVAHLFAADWEAGDVRFPTLDEALGFIADYEAGRGAAFGAAERTVARAALLYAMAYTARCEHSDALTGFGTHPADLHARARPRAAGQRPGVRRRPRRDAAGRQPPVTSSRARARSWTLDIAFSPMIVAWSSVSGSGRSRRTARRRGRCRARRAREACGTRSGETRFGRHAVDRGGLRRIALEQRDPAEQRDRVHVQDPVALCADRARDRGRRRSRQDDAAIAADGLEVLQQPFVVIALLLDVLLEVVDELRGDGVVRRERPSAITAVSSMGRPCGPSCGG